MKFIELKKHLMTGKYKAGYLIVGDDACVCQKASQLIIDRVESFPELNVSFFNENGDVCDMVASCNGIPMMSPLRVVGINNYDKDLTPFVNYFKNPNSQCIVYFLTPKITEHYKPLMKYLEVVDCNKLDDHTLNLWINRQAQLSGRTISTQANNLLIKYCNSNLSRITAEMDKLLSFKEDSIEEEDIKQMVVADLEYKVYELSEAISNKQTDRALKLLYDMLGDNVSPISLFGMLQNHFRRLLYVSINPDAETLARDLGVKEMAIKIALRQSKMFTPKKLKKICDDLHSFDYKIKNGEINDKLAIQTFVLKTLNA